MKTLSWLFFLPITIIRTVSPSPRVLNPEVEYGWIQPGCTLVDSRVHPLHRASRFREEPMPGQAHVLRRRGCLWNTFVTIGLAAAFLELLDATVPQLTRSLEASSRMPERLVVLQDGSLSARLAWLGRGPKQAFGGLQPRSKAAGL
jgi:mannose-1-phosphate guanylyltransferase